MNTLTSGSSPQRMKLTRTDAARHDATRAADIIKAKEALVTIRVGRGRKEQTQQAISPKLARLLSGIPGMGTARALLELAATDDELRRAGEAQGIDWEAWGESVEAARLEDKRV
jgi:5-carboxymethyl-2-hydroxymuconate isomerase